MVVIKGWWLSEKMELDGNCVLTPIYSTREDKDSYAEEELLILGKMHREKIKMPEAILVVNVGGYIGESTKSEIEFANSLNKKICTIQIYGGKTNHERLY